MAGKQVDKARLDALTFGFDIGIASVGWCVLGQDRIIDLGVRCFDEAETAKEGESLNLARRTARLMRHRLRHRAWRLTKLARLLKRHGLLSDANFFHLPSATPQNLWQLRVAGLDRRLTPEEWARVIYHVNKHRGFHWISKAEEKKAEGDAKGEGGRVKRGLANTTQRMTEKQYRSAAEMVLTEFPHAQRNKQGDYGKALSRILLAAELTQLFEQQRRLGNTHATPALQEAILGSGDRNRSGLFWSQKPALAGSDLLKMLGKCTFERNEFRAPKASFTAERHVWLTRLNNLRIVVDGVSRPLNEDERRIALPLPYEYADARLDYKRLRTALKNRLDNFHFAGVSEDKEKDILVKLPAWETLSKALKGKLDTEWKGMAGAAIGGDPTLLDEIARVLSVYKNGAEVEDELRKLNLPGGQSMIDALSEVGFDKFHSLSLKALRRIVPLMESGLRYDEAVAQIPEYGHHSQLFEAGSGDRQYLPPFYSKREADGRMVFNDELDVPRNPVVLRSLNQARKVMNALIRKYKRQPTAVHIEMARDLSRPLDGHWTDNGKYIEGRRDILSKQEEDRARNDKDKTQFEEYFRQPPTGSEFAKWRLYSEQQGKCAYSLAALDLHRLLEPGYVDIDHALPYSRSYDDSKNNKVLVLTKENRDKGNRTPYEYLGGEENSSRWLHFVSFVESNKNYRLAKRSRLLRKNFGAEEAKAFSERNLNDTRYICKFFKNYVERYLQLADGSETKRCVVLSGQLTAFLRARWGFLKVRAEGDRHHALDAAVVAACSHSMVKRLADYNRRKELENARTGFIDPTTGEIVDIAMNRQLQQHFPDPWPHFRSEVDARLNIDSPAELQERLKPFGTYSPEALAATRPLFVSRAPQRRNSGAAHKETIYGQTPRLAAEGGVTQKKPLTSLTAKDLDRLIDPHRNEKLYAAIRARLEAHGKADKAFPAENPLHKPDRDGNPTGPIVRTVTLVIDKLSGIPIRGGIAKNDTMLRLDIFNKTGKFYLVPVYVHHAIAKELPNRAIVAFKGENEWTLIDESFDFVFSAHPNDLLKVTIKGQTFSGYYAGCDRSTGAIGLWSHDRNQNVGKDGLFRGIGLKTALAIEKFHVDVLGNIYPAPQEKRRGLA